MSNRAIVLGLAGVRIPLALLVLVFPITWGYRGYIYGPVAYRVGIAYEWLTRSASTAVQR